MKSPEDLSILGFNVELNSTSVSFFFGVLVGFLALAKILRFTRNRSQTLNDTSINLTEEFLNQTSPAMQLYINRFEDIKAYGGVKISPDVPLRYMKECDGRLPEARLKWKKTLEWRQKNMLDTILQEQQPLFHIIKKHSPHFWHSRDKEGRPVYYDLLGKIDVPTAVSKGVNVENYVRHCLFCAEFLWNVIDPNDNQQMIAVMDVKGLGLRSLSGFALEIFQQQSKINAAHFPGRNYKTFIVNAPSWFSLISPIILRALDSKTRENLTVLSNDFTELHTLISKDNIPPRYGGSSVELGYSEEENALRECVRRIASTEMIAPAGMAPLAGQ
eukprot:CAMPEP_0117754062 /NCGR_PEP_ID=MMETSP0947-20121206/12606_1 /TAXON_ID=44440 /ORGANISM="Chattonella subsalsa, Strain CCMP2191" /LENGTH=329 /DNA_ID=CAMNT_0005573081 /DNA_START=758 /DNA_END=1747 /DNA_ORIENTATION=+